MSNCIKFLKLFFILNFLVINNSFSEETIKRFIVAGHLYTIVEDENKLEKFANKINSYSPDRVFILGDSSLHDKKVYDKFNNLISSQLYFTPGEQELKNSLEKFKKNVGYFDLLLVEKNIRFLLLNSSADVSKIKENLLDFLKDDFKYGPTVIMVNHRIWDDTLLSKKSMQHDKSFYFEEIYPLIKDKVNYIFAGDGKRQYFRDLEDKLNYGKQNVNVIHWLDKIGKINAYAVGTGDGDPKAIFTIVDILNNNELHVKGDFSTVQDYDILPKNLISADKLKLTSKYTGGNYYFINKKKLFLSLTILFCLIILLIFYKKVIKK